MRIYCFGINLIFTYVIIFAGMVIEKIFGRTVFLISQYGRLLVQKKRCVLSFGITTCFSTRFLDFDCVCIRHQRSPDDIPSHLTPSIGLMEHPCASHGESKSFLVLVCCIFPAIRFLHVHFLSGHFLRLSVEQVDGVGCGASAGYLSACSRNVVLEVLHWLLRCVALCSCVIICSSLIVDEQHRGSESGRPVKTYSVREFVAEVIV